MIRRLLRWESRRKAAVLFDRAGAELDLSTNSSGNLRTAQLYPLLSLKQVDVAPDSILTKTSGSVTYDATTSSSVLSDSSILQSAWYVDYQAGLPQVTQMTYVPGAGTQRIGYFDAADGVFVELSGSTPSFVLRVGGVDTAIARADWSHDKLDGTGPSRLVADFAKMKRFFARFAWLGIGPVEYGFILRGVPIVCHVAVADDSLTEPFMRTPSLPLRWETVGTGSSLRAICGAVGSEGGQSLRGVPGVAERLDATAVLAAGTYELASIRLAGTARTTVLLGQGYATMSSNDRGVIRLLHNPTFSVATGWAASGGSAAVEHNLSAPVRTVTDPGRVLVSVPFTQDSRVGSIAVDPIVPLTRAIDGTPDVLTLAITLAANATVSGAALNYRVVP